MTHDRDHIVIHSLRQTVSVGAEDVPPKRHTMRLWHVCLALWLIGFLTGAAIS